jgi:hypothetical protein
MNHVIHGTSDLLSKRFVLTGLYRANDSAHGYSLLSFRSTASGIVHRQRSFEGVIAGQSWSAHVDRNCNRVEIQMFIIASGS